MRHVRIAGQYVDDRFLVGSINEAALAMSNGFASRRSQQPPPPQFVLQRCKYKLR